jgi:hypothetical protein
MKYQDGHQFIDKSKNENAARYKRTTIYKSLI